MCEDMRQDLKSEYLIPDWGWGRTKNASMCSRHNFHDIVALGVVGHFPWLPKMSTEILWNVIFDLDTINYI